MQKKLKEMSRDLLFAVLLSLVMIAGTLAAIFSVNGIMTEYAVHQMQKMARHAASDVKIMFSSEEQKVMLIADMLAGHGILQEADFQRYIHTLSLDDDLFDYCALRPDNSMVDGGGETGVLAEPLDFAQEAARAPYFADGITGRDGEKYLLYAYPVRDGDEVRAVAYGYAPLRKLPELFHRYGFGGQEQIYLVNGDTGNFLIDTWRGELGNIFDDDLQYGEMKQGRSLAQLQQDVAEGQPVLWCLPHRLRERIFTAATSRSDCITLPFRSACRSMFFLRMYFISAVLFRLWDCCSFWRLSVIWPT